MPGEGSSSDPHPTGTAELVHVIEGELTLTVDGVEYRVPAGATASFEANTTHTYGNTGDVPMVMVMAVSVPPVP
jgi:uncharacterized cupin superfamily protein